MRASEIVSLRRELNAKNAELADVHKVLASVSGDSAQCSVLMRLLSRRVERGR